jgi:hypothetical protein
VTTRSHNCGALVWHSWRNSVCPNGSSCSGGIAAVVSLWVLGGVIVVSGSISSSYLFCFWFWFSGVIVAKHVLVSGFGSLALL